MVLINLISNLVSYLWVYTAGVNNYVELDHNLVPRSIDDINVQTELSGRVKTEPRGYFQPHTLMVNKYHLEKEDMKIVLQKFKNLKNDSKQYEAVIGSDEEVWYDHDWGFFSAVLAAYNNHWVLKTSPDDWWNVVVKNVAQVVDEKGNLPTVRKFFVAHEGKKEITITVGPTLHGIDYSWLFNQFSEQIKLNVKTPGYVDLIQADFSTTTPQQLITTQIMLMASVQKYFDYGMRTMCGIPGVDMVGTLEDWEKLVEKLDKLEVLLRPIMRDLEMGDWFVKAKEVLSKLLDTKRGNPDTEWWGHILSWNEVYGSGARQWWSGWLPEFLMANGEMSKPRDFPRGLVSVPLKIKDENNLPAVNDTGILVAGTVGFTVEEGGRAPAVMARQGWTLLMPVGSPVTPRLLGDRVPTEVKYKTLP